MEFCLWNSKLKKQNGYTEQLKFRFGFEYIQVVDDFEIELIKFQRNTAFCGNDGLPYALLIGKTKSESIPEKITVLSYCDNRTFNVGDKLKIKPTKNPTDSTSLNPIYFVKDTLINGNKTKWVIGSENKAIWGRPDKLNE